ncbi:phosphatase PAP2 family protein [Salinirussus salinus]|uniref:phosphatase PAP2 family protein n=1 Tax=Salinirussus salinus TaxID=1198300 RepID=UPI00135801C3|nr:phosphatase PAP2 family protein [Salinirussus salinus]
MTRGIGGVEFAGSLPDAVVAAGGLLTQLGDMWFLLLAIGALYWRARGGAAPGFTPMPFRDCLLLLALAVGSYAAAAALKSAFAFPRPPGAGTAVLPAWLPPAASPVYEAMVTADGYGFPSGHATAATAVYGGMAVLLRAGTRRLRYAAAAAVVTTVALSRVVIGVHYLVDVVAGVLLGLAVLGTLLALGRRLGAERRTSDTTDAGRADTRSPAPALAGAALLAAVALALSPGFERLLGLLGAAGGLGLWLVRRPSTAPSLRGS